MQPRRFYGAKNLASFTESPNWQTRRWDCFEKKQSPHDFNYIVANTVIQTTEHARQSGMCSMSENTFLRCIIAWSTSVINMAYNAEWNNITSTWRAKGRQRLYFINTWSEIWCEGSIRCAWMTVLCIKLQYDMPSSIKIRYHKRTNLQDSLYIYIYIYRSDIKKYNCSFCD